jgi:hypothetical protein
MASDAVCGAESRRQGRGAQQRAARASNGLVVVVWLSSQHQRGDDTGNGRCCGLVGPARCWVSLQALPLCLLDLTCAGGRWRTSRAVAVVSLGRLIAMMPDSWKSLWRPLTTSSSALIMSSTQVEHEFEKCSAFLCLACTRFVCLPACSHTCHTCHGAPHTALSSSTLALGLWPHLKQRCD